MMIRTDEEYQAAERVVKGLEKKFKAGEASEAEIERMKAGQDHILIYTWYREWQEIKSNPPPVREVRNEKIVASISGPVGGVVAHVNGNGNARPRLAPRSTNARKSG